MSQDKVGLDNVINQLNSKFEAVNQSTEDRLLGLLHGAPITYWDYINLDAILGLQVQRTESKDEMVFIIYHQINELIFKMILWETSQIIDDSSIKVEVFKDKIQRITRYFDMLTNSFDIMYKGMSVEQYKKFRYTLIPASGFQSFQFRLIEFASTDILNLIDKRFVKNMSEDSSNEDLYESLYWQAAGKDFKTGTKSQLLFNFEKKYKKQFIETISKCKENNIYKVYNTLSNLDKKDSELIKVLREFDYVINISWVKAHFNAAEYFLDNGKKAETKSTGGSNWKKYMHPKYQKRIFFPELWSESEIENWGE
jgi:tryptophan 2,3-dioxygenase